MKNICFFNSNTVWGGGEKWHYEMALRLRKQGYPVLVMTNQASELFGRLAHEDIALQQVGISNLSFLNPLKILQIKRVFQQYRIHTVFLNLPSDVKAGGIAARLANVEKIIYRRGTALPVKNTALNRFFFRRILTGVIANSAEIKRTILQRNPHLIPEDKITILYNGVDLEAYDRQPEQPLYQRQGDEIILGNAGRFVAQKGQKYLIDLAKILQTQGMKFKLLIAGKGELEAELRAYARTSGVEHHLVFIGFVEHIKRFLDSLDIFIFPSLHEGSSHIVLEAMASQKPVIAFQISSNPELIIPHETGFLAEPHNVPQLAQYVRDLILDEYKRRLFGVNARKRVEEHFDLRRVVTQITTLIEA
jgi:glycosyltransferase involved in cell wall biosynthesis